MLSPIVWWKENKGVKMMANCKCREFLDSMILECDWKDMALMGICAGSLGKLCGMLIPAKYKNVAAFTAGTAFFLSAIGLVVRTVDAAREDEFDEYEDFEEWENWDDDDVVEF